MAFPVGVLVHGDQARDAGALEVEPADHVARALGRHQRDIDVLRGRDGSVEDGEAVAREQQIAGLEPALDLLPDGAMQLVGHEQHHDVALMGGRRRIGHAQSVALGLGHAGGAGPESYDDVHAGVLEVVGVGVAL